MARSIPLSLLGTWVQGDLGPLTIYTNRFGKKVAYEKAPPTRPPTERQRTQRTRFSTAQRNWSILSLEEKSQLELACTRASLCLTGQNLYIIVALKNHQTAYRTLERQTKTTLPQVAWIP